MATLLMLGSSLTARGDTFVIDQSNSNANFTRNIYHLGPLGQEFTPTLQALDVVELLMDDASCSQVGSPGGSALVRIREASIAGPIIGTSATSHFPNCFVGILRFEFPSVIPLTSGSLYVIEAVYVSGNTSAAAGYDGTSTYSGGREIIEGVPHEDKDLWFREGLANFIPETKDECRKGGWQELVRPDGTPFRNQGDCIHYVNTGK
jgi:hypothetical protein